MYLGGCGRRMQRVASVPESGRGRPRAHFPAKKVTASREGVAACFVSAIRPGSAYSAAARSAKAAA